MTIKECNHRWIFVKDWYGDSNVINGTQDSSFMRCKRCGREAPVDRDELHEPDADEWRDRMEERRMNEGEGEI